MVAVHITQEGAIVTSVILPEFSVELSQPLYYPPAKSFKTRLLSPRLIKLRYRKQGYYLSKDKNSSKESFTNNLVVVAFISCILET